MAEDKGEKEGEFLLSILWAGAGVRSEVQADLYS